jgi:epoxyqueuosine reductase QueG
MNDIEICASSSGPTKVDLEEVKKIARDIGADLVGVVATQTLEDFPPDPRWPQVPSRISPHGKSVIVVAKHIPAGAYRLKMPAADRYINNLVLRRVDRIAHALASRLEELGHPSLAVITNETAWKLKRGTYGYLSTRHLAVEAGMGTIGLNLNLVTPEYGSRVQLAAVLSELETEVDSQLTEQVCVGEGCSRCLYSCPPDAVGHFTLDKRGCSTCAQMFGYAMLTAHLGQVLKDPDKTGLDQLKTASTFNHWLAMTRVAGCYGACLRCVAVCPVGVDYDEFLAEDQRQIPENTPEKIARGKAYKAARRAGEEVPGLDEYNIRWVGPEGYTGRAAREYKKSRPTK